MMSSKVQTPFVVVLIDSLQNNNLIFRRKKNLKRTPLFYVSKQKSYYLKASLCRISIEKSWLPLLLMQMKFNYDFYYKVGRWGY